MATTFAFSLKTEKIASRERILAIELWEANEEDGTGNSYATAHEAGKAAYDEAVRRELLKFKRAIEINKQCVELYVHNTGKDKWFWITVSPDTSKISINKFIELVDKFRKKKPIQEYTLSFEQRGTSEDTLGNGFHVHILTKAKWGSKADCLRACLLFFQDCAANNCIEVKITTNPEDIKQNYLVDYKSEDNHKVLTKEWDTLWRKKIGIYAIYNTGDAVIKSRTASKPLGVVSWD